MVTTGIGMVIQLRKNEAARPAARRRALRGRRDWICSRMSMW